MLSDSSSVKVSPLDLVTSILRGRMSSGDQANVSDDSGEAESEVMTLLLEKNREVVAMALTTAFAVLIGCVFLYLWRVSSNQKAAEKNKKALEVARKPMMAKEDEDDGKKKVTILFGTQTGTAEGFAKVLTFYELSQILQ